MGCFGCEMTDLGFKGSHTLRCTCLDIIKKRIAHSGCNRVRTWGRSYFWNQTKQKASRQPRLHRCSQSAPSHSFTPCTPLLPTSLTHSTHLKKGFPSEANSNMHLPSDPWPWADKVTSRDFYSRFWLHTSVRVSPLHHPPPTPPTTPPEIVRQILS